MMSGESWSKILAVLPIAIALFRYVDCANETLSVEPETLAVCKLILDSPRYFNADL